MMHGRSLFEIGDETVTGVDWPETDLADCRLGDVPRRSATGLLGLSEPEAMRHYTRLSRMNFSIDIGTYPLGSCTMKHNPRLNEKVARLEGFSDPHPLQPFETVTGALSLMGQLTEWLITLTGMPGLTLMPAAGAQGELAGMLAIKAAHAARGEKRSHVLAPDSAHGTNPATAAALGYVIDHIPAGKNGRVDLDAFRARLDSDVAAIMLTNPNTCGLFEPDIISIARAVHDAGAYFYCDGANFNALIGKVRPGDLGVDAMHLNLHKTFGTPHGGGGPGSGPVLYSERLVPFAPFPRLERDGTGWRLIERSADVNGEPLGRLRSFHGQFSVYVRALAYCMALGAEGLRQVAEDSVLAANYVFESLKDVMHAPFPGPCMHECLFDDAFWRDSGVSTLDMAKAMLDEGLHPMTVYFPLVVSGAMLVEPTETESKADLDRLILILRDLAVRAASGDTDFFKAAPVKTPKRRLDETRAARHPCLCRID